MVDINNIYNETRSSTGLNLDMDRLHSLDVFSVDGLNSTAAVDHYLELERSAKFESDYTDGFSLGLFKGDRFSEVGRSEDVNPFMPAMIMGPLFFMGRVESPLDPAYIFDGELQECPKDDRAIPEFIQLPIRVGDPPPQYIDLPIRMDDPPPCIIYL